MATGRDRGATVSRHTERHLVFLSLACCLILVVACGKNTIPTTQIAGAPPSADGPLRIGLLLDYTGALGTLGEATEEGAQFAVELINAAGGVRGRDVELIAADGATDPETSVEAAHRLITQEGVTAIIGPLGSAAALAVAREVTIEKRVPIVCPAATTPELTELSDDAHVFRTCLSDSAQGPALAWIAQERGFERVALLYRNDPYGRGLRESFSDSFSGEVTAAVEIDPYQQTYLEELKTAAADSPQALVTMAFAAEGEVFLAEALNNGLISSFVFSDAMAHYFMLDGVGAERLAGVRGAFPRGGGSISDELKQNWTDAFVERFGHQPSALAQATYDAVLCISLAAEKASSTEGTAIRKAFPTVSGGTGELTAAVEAVSVKHALAAVRAGGDINYEGLSCSMDLTSNGDLATGIVEIFEISNGLFNVIQELPIEVPSST
ncbi:MAG: ABC transporter substrate-binding protein [bacterium]|nr:ABC transporter substrate-binding protein [bacterium]